MDIQKLSTRFSVTILTEKDIDVIYELCAGNPLFYQYCPPFITRKAILEDLKALPPNKTYDDKYYVGFWEEEQLVAIMDLIVGYPDEKTAFIGLFMLEKSMQGLGCGSRIIEECSQFLKREGFAFIRLGYAKGNPQSEHFWKKNGFEDTGIEVQNEGYVVVVLQKTLS